MGLGVKCSELPPTHILRKFQEIPIKPLVPLLDFVTPSFTKPVCLALVLAGLFAAVGLANCANARGKQPLAENLNARGPHPAITNAPKDPIFNEFFRRTNGWVAGDGALSVPLSDGRVRWLFGDSFIDCYTPAIPTCGNGRMQPGYYRPKAIRVPLELLAL